MKACSFLHRVALSLLPALALLLPLSSCGGGGGGAAGGISGDSLVPDGWFKPAGCSEVKMSISNETENYTVELVCTSEESVENPALSGMLDENRSTYQQGSETRVTLKGEWEQRGPIEANAIYDFTVAAEAPVAEGSGVKKFSLESLGIIITSKDESSSEKTLVLHGHALSGTLTYGDEVSYQLGTEDKVTLTYTYTYP